MTISLLAVITFVVFLSLYRSYTKSEKSLEIRQCSYGNKKIYTALENSSDYAYLKALFTPEATYADRYLISVSISRLYPINVLEQWLNDEPNSADAQLCYGARLVQWSWEARGYGMGKQISQEKWELFFERLAITRDILTQCAETMPEDPTPWAYLIMVSTWDSDEQDVRDHYYQQAIDRDPTNWAAHMHMVIALSEKWGGDNEEMIAFAEKASNDAPDGSDLPAILIKAYIENWKYLNLFDKKPEEAKQFLLSREVQEKAALAYVRSVGSENHAQSSVSVFTRYNTSAWFWLVRDKLNLKNDLEVLGNTIEDIHWRWAGPEGELDKARAFVNNN